MTIPKKWKIENIKAPTLACKQEAEIIVKHLYDEYSLNPLRIEATIEEGIFVNYRNFNNDNILSIEIYNDHDIACILTNGKNIIKSMDIKDGSFTEIIRLFFKRLGGSKCK